jgi:hypothetical protein
MNAAAAEIEEEKWIVKEGTWITEKELIAAWEKRVPWLAPAAFPIERETGPSSITMDTSPSIAIAEKCMPP